MCLTLTSPRIVWLKDSLAMIVTILITNRNVPSALWGSEPTFHHMLQGQSTPRNKEISPELVVHLSQNRLLPLVMQQTGDADIRFGHSIDTTNQVQGKEGVTVSGRCDSSGETFQVDCDYLIAADGANSRIRCIMILSARNELLLPSL